MRIPYRKPGPYALIKPDFLITKEKHGELERELEKLKTCRPETAAEVARLAELGDFSENAEYQHAKGRLRGINSAILKIQSQLNNAVIIKRDVKNNQIQIGSAVIVEFGGKKKTYLILGSNETDPSKGIISHLSPIGAALIGRQTKDVVKIKLADKEVVYKILEIK